MNTSEQNRSTYPRRKSADPEEHGCDCGRQASHWYHSTPVCARCREIESRLDRDFHDDVAEGRFGDRRKRVRPDVGFFDPVLGSHRCAVVL